MTNGTENSDSSSTASSSSSSSSGSSSISESSSSSSSSRSSNSSPSVKSSKSKKSKSSKRVQSNAEENKREIEKKLNRNEKITEQSSRFDNNINIDPNSRHDHDKTSLLEVMKSNINSLKEQIIQLEASLTKLSHHCSSNVESNVDFYSTLLEQ